MPTLSIRRLNGLLFSFAAGALLTGCAVSPNSPAPAPAADTQTSPETGVRGGLDPLFEAKDRQVVACVSVNPLSTQNPLASIVFECPELSVSATLAEMRDAGWRLESMDVGQQASIDGMISMPLKITIRKLF